MMMTVWWNGIDKLLQDSGKSYLPTGLAGPPPFWIGPGLATGGGGFLFFSSSYLMCDCIKEGIGDIKEIVWVQTWFSQPHVLPPPSPCLHLLSLLALRKPEHEIISEWALKPEQPNAVAIEELTLSECGNYASPNLITEYRSRPIQPSWLTCLSASDMPLHRSATILEISPNFTPGFSSIVIFRTCSQDETLSEKDKQLNCL